MKGFHPDPPSAAEVRENWRVLNDVADELYFRRNYVAGRGSLTSGAAVNLNSRGAVVDFPNALNPTWRWDEERAVRWRRAGIYLRLRYTTDAAGGGNFLVKFFLGNYDAGDNLATIALYTTTLTVPAPAANSDVSTLEFVDTASTIIPGNKSGIAMLLQRMSGDAADTSANVLQVLSVHLRVLPQG